MVAVVAEADTIGELAAEAPILFVRPLMSDPVSAILAPLSTLCFRLLLPFLPSPSRLSKLPRRCTFCRPNEPTGDEEWSLLGNWKDVGEPNEDDKDGGGTMGYESVRTVSN
jgi:hypothetical protein